MTRTARPADDAPRRRRGRRALLAVILVTLVAVVAVGVVTLRDRAVEPTGTDITVVASSTARGTDAGALVAAALDIEEPEPAPLAAVDDAGAARDLSEWHPGDVTWRSGSEAKGTWLRLNWTGQRTISHIRLDGAGGPDNAYSAAVVMFDTGAAVWVTPDARGNVSADIGPRSAGSAVIRFVDSAGEASAVALRAAALDDSGSRLTSAGPTAATSSDGAGSDAGALLDGDIGAGTLRSAWRPDADDPAPWAALTWHEPVEIASIQVTGIIGHGDDLRGTLRMSDGSAIPVSGIASGQQPVTTVAFTPRTVSWVRLDLEGSPIALGEFRAYPSEETPPRWPAASGAAVTAAPAGACGASSPPADGEPATGLTLLCPSPGSSVGGTATVVVAANPGDAVIATAYDPAEADEVVVASASADTTGRAALAVDMARLTAGPTALRVTGSSSWEPLYVQLFNTDGVASPSDGHAPAGMTLRYEEEFTGPLSITRTGAGADYAAAKPEAEGWSDFGAAVFADPAWGTDTLATLEDEYLRIRVSPLGDRTDPTGGDRSYLGGILSSARVGASGFSAQYGYFEARMLGPAGEGTWPAFWMLDTEVGRTKVEGAGEVDAVELYGHNPSGSCHRIHNWQGQDPDSERACVGDNGGADWALAWHDYGVLIRPDGAEMYLDGRLVTSWDRFDRDALPYYFLIDLALGGGWPVDLDAVGGTADLYVDWVRVYT